MIPIPPACAIAIARRASVTVSIAADTRGTLRWIVLVSRLRVSTWLGSTRDRAGTSRTSSNVRPSGRGGVSMDQFTRFQWGFQARSGARM